MKRLVIFVILFSMTLHCASRIGFLSYLYQQRHEIAYTVGLISEAPIAMCNSDYDFNDGLVIQEHKTYEGGLPPVAFQASEIHLFFNTSADFDIKPNRPTNSIDNQTVVVDHAYKTPALAIFHPPS